MTQGEAKIIETEVVLFSAKTERENASPAEEAQVIEAKKRTLKIDIEKRFARLRKSMRKRSASIF